MSAPKYEILRTELEQLITSGLDAHAPLPSERELMAQYGLSRMTVREALTRLAEDGLVYRVQGAGTFVSDLTKITKSLTLTSFSEDIRARGMVPGSRASTVTWTEADADTASVLNISPGARIVHMERVRTADGLPMCLENVWISAELVPENFELDENSSLYDYLEGIGRGPVTASQTIQATVLTTDQANLLEVPPYSPALAVSRVTADAQGRVVEQAKSLYRADRYDFHVTVEKARGR
ncbi:GntR family transcriptional regulator [Arthrobacter frigidicola]|nr:GntR family transcriptional regulator [Arthrobacter frigidicola]